MPRFPRLWLDDLLARTDIVQVISGYMQLKKNGHRYWGLCPFHGEKTASFSVDSERQLYHCFGCKASGDVITFVKEYERIDFSDAVARIADLQHIPLPQMENDPDYQRRKTQRERLLAANRDAAKWFHDMLFSEAGKGSLEYLKGRGLNDTVIRRFGLGAAPDQWDALCRHMLTLGYTQQELKLCGLIVVKEAEPATADRPARPKRAFDMFRNRAIFPIIDQYGNVLAFGGRAIDGAQPKYLNTSDTPVFNKRLGVYAANLLRKERHLERIILVEGYMDVVALSQFGVTGVCATLGTALTPQQAKLLQHFAPSVYLSYDGDSAGQHAILRGLDILRDAGVPARVLDFPEGLDPDEFIRKYGLQGYQQLPALTPETYRMRRLKAEHDLSTQDGRVAYAKACAPILKDLEPVDLQIHLQQLMVQTGFTRQVLLAQIDRAPFKPAQKPTPPNAQGLQTPRAILHASSKGGDRQRAQEIIISLLATKRIGREIATQQDFQDPLLKLLYAGLAEGRSPASMVQEMEAAEDRARATELLMSPPTDDDTDQLLRMAQQCLNRMRYERTENRMAELKTAIATMSPQEKAAAIQEYKQLTLQLQKLKLS